MLKRDRRISREILKKLVKRRFYVSSYLLSARLFENIENREADSRFSFSVSKKIEKNAVLRNKMRRIGYECVRANLDKIKKGFYVRFLYHKKPQVYKKEVIMSEVLEILLETRLIKE